MDESMWGHLPLLVRSNSKESVEYILQALWRTRNTGLDSADRDIIRDMLQLPTDSDLDPLLVCLRILMRRCVYENFSKDDIHKLFPQEVSPELQRLLTLLLQKFQREWRDDALKDQVSLPRLKAMTWNMANQDAESTDHIAVINLKLQDDTQSLSGETEVKFQLAKDTMETMLRSLHYIRNQLSNTVSIVTDNVVERLVRFANPRCQQVGPTMSEILATHQVGSSLNARSKTVWTALIAGFFVFIAGGWLHFFFLQSIFLQTQGLDLFIRLLFKPGYICSVACWMSSWGLAHGTNL